MYPSISGIVSCLPKTRIKNDFFEPHLGEKTVSDIAKMTGVQTRYWVDSGQTTADLCIAAARRLADGGKFDLKKCDAVIFVSQTPDYILPGSAFVVHRSLGLASSCTCLDINSGCSGYVLGLSLAHDLIKAGRYKNILLLAGDTISKTITPQDRSTAMIFGDAGTATLITAIDGASRADFIIGSDSSGVDSLKIESGLFRTPEKTGTNDDYLFMDGAAVFNFTLKSIPKLIADLADVSGKTAQDFDHVLMHQANGFMLRHIAKKAKLDPARVPINIGKFGNTSSATLPLLLCNDVDLTVPKNYALLGFGVGFSWAAASLEIGPVSFVDTLFL
jgi:3-oxoacyl-[acyl-carrier-protein] synthase III